MGWSISDVNLRPRVTTMMALWAYPLKSLVSLLTQDLPTVGYIWNPGLYEKEETHSAPGFAGLFFLTDDAMGTAVADLADLTASP